VPAGGELPTSADVVVVGGGTIGGWCACFLREAGAGRVVLLERDRLGVGASSRAAGIVRAQGGTSAAVRLALWTQAFYRGQRESTGVDSGFVPQGYLLPAFTQADVEAGHRRLAMQRELGLDVRWLAPDEVEALDPVLAPESTLGATYAPGDGYLDPPRNVAAYTAALHRSGVGVHEGTAFLGVRRARGGRIAAVRTTAGEIATVAVVLTGGPDLRAVGAAMGVAVPVGRVRHQVAVTRPHPELGPSRGGRPVPMVFDLGRGLYWRPEDGGLLFGMSNPDEPPGDAEEVDWAYLEAMRCRLEDLVPATRGLGLRKVWAATIEYTPDHLPIVGPALDRDGPVVGAVVATAAGHGMMCGPGVSRAAADLLLVGRTDVVDLTDLGLDRFDAAGASRLAGDPIALPFPEEVVGD
jgi:sarcosine oxidase subunit beta